MIIEYIYIKKYKDLIDSIDLNFGGKNIYRYVNGKIDVHINKNYIENFYLNNECIGQISAIIGKNSTGKTTILRIINMIFSGIETDFKYVIIYRHNDDFFYDSNMNNITFKSKNINKKRIKFIKDLKLVYFSSIFDKSNSMLGNYQLIDISSNTLLREFVASYFTKQINSIESSFIEQESKLLEKIKNKNTDIIDDFRKSESILKLKYVNSMNNLCEGSKFEPLFKSPKFISISYADDSINKIDKLNQLTRYTFKMKDGEKIIERMREVDDLTFEIIQKSNEFCDDKKIKYKNEFIGMLSFEVFSKLIIEYEYNIYKYIDMFLNLIYEKEDNEYDFETAFREVLFKINGDYLRNYEVTSESYLVDEKRDDYDNIDYLDKLLFNINDLYEKNKELEEEIYYYDIQEFKIHINNIINSIKGFDYSKIEVVNEVLGGQNKDISYLHCDENDLCFILEFLEENYKKLLDIDYIDNEIEITLKNISNINEQLEIIIKKIEEKSISNVDKDIDVEFEEVPEEVVNQFNNDLKNELDDELINYIEKIINLIDENDKLIDSNTIITDIHNILMLKTEWRNEEIIDYISLFEKFEFESFYLIYDHEELSSGQNAYLDMNSRLLNLKEKLKLYKDIILIIDEGDINLHPEVQIQFVNNLISFLGEFFENKVFHVILTTNSPFIVSDIPNTSLIYLERKGKKIQLACNNISDMKTFGVNINELLIDTFYMKKGIIGTFAQERINYIIDSLKRGKQNSQMADFIEKNIDLIGDELLHNKLKKMYTDVYGVDNERLKREINSYKRKIIELESMLNND